MKFALSRRSDNRRQPSRCYGNNNIFATGSGNCLTILKCVLICEKAQTDHSDTGRLSFFVTATVAAVTDRFVLDDLL